MASVETNLPSKPDETVEGFRAGMARRARTMDNASSCHAEKYPMKWLLSVARSRAALSGGLARHKGRGI